MVRGRGRYNRPHDSGHHPTTEVPASTDPSGHDPVRGRRSALSVRPLFAVVLAAGQGTRMRSTRPKPLHMLCGRPLVRYVLDAVAGSETDRAVVVVGYGAEMVIKTLQEDPGSVPLEFVEQRVAAGHRRRRGRGPDRAPRRPRPRRRRRRRRGAARATPRSCAPRRSRPSCASTACRARRAPCSPPGSTTPPATGGSCATRTAGSGASSSTATPTPPSGPSTRSTRASTCSAAACSRPRCAGSPPTTRRASCTSPTSSRSWPRPATLWSSLVADDASRDPGRQRPCPAGGGRGRAAAPHERPLDARGGRHGRPRRHLRRHHRRARPRRRPVPRHGPAGRHRRRPGHRDRARHPPRPTPAVGARAKVNETVATLAEIGDDAVVGPFAVLEPGARVGEGVRTGPFYTGGTG